MTSQKVYNEVKRSWRKIEDLKFLEDIQLLQASPLNEAVETNCEAVQNLLMGPQPFIQKNVFEVCFLDVQITFVGIPSSNLLTCKLQNCDIIGMTTTGAAKNHRLLSLLQVWPLTRFFCFF